MRRVAFLGFVLVAGLLSGCAGGKQESRSAPAGSQTAPEAGAEPAASPSATGESGGRFVLRARAFEEGGVLPDEYTGNGRDISPELIWENPPAGVQSFALICEDPDAPGRTFVHWVIYDIPADRQRLARAIPRQPEFDGMRQGRNDFGSVGYRGPMPPPGRAHRYFFRLFALNQQTGLEPGAGADELRQAMAGHLLAEAGLMCTYRR